MIRSIWVFIPFLLLISCQRNGDTLSPEAKPLMEAVYASGYVVAKGEYEVYAQAEGYLIDKRVLDGDTIHKGDVLFVLDADQQAARYRIAKEAYEEAVKDYRDQSPVLRELKAALDAVKTKMQFDSVNYIRYTNLLRQDAIARADYDRMKLAYENSRSEYVLQKSRYEKTKSQLQLALSNARNQLQIAGDESSRYAITSLVDGLIFYTTKEEGELVRRGELLAVAGDADDFYFQLTIDERDVNRVAKGQRVLVKIDAYPDRIFEARVSHVYPMVDKRQQSVRVDATLIDELPGHVTGLALEANIVIREKKEAVVIPKAALMAGDSVMVEVDGDTRKVKVQTGIITLDEVEILDGVSLQDKVIVSH